MTITKTTKMKIEKKKIEQRRMQCKKLVTFGRQEIYMVNTFEYNNTEEDKKSLYHFMALTSTFTSFASNFCMRRCD